MNGLLVIVRWQKLKTPILISGFSHAVELIVRVECSCSHSHFTRSTNESLCGSFIIQMLNWMNFSVIFSSYIFNSFSLSRITVFHLRVHPSAVSQSPRYLCLNVSFKATRFSFTRTNSCIWNSLINWIIRKFPLTFSLICVVRVRGWNLIKIR